MDIAPRCQSCGMPIGEGYYGLDEDGHFSMEYCKFCFHGGFFVDPELTLEEMIRRSIDYMTRELCFPEEKARMMAEEVIPLLKRWKN